jgi:hypothetical protein
MVLLILFLPSPGAGSRRKAPKTDLPGQSEDMDPRGLALLNILNACGQLGLIFTVDELSMAKQSIYEKTMQAALKAPR